MAHEIPVFRLPSIFSDHAVLQRSADTAVWGTASPQERISVSLGPAHSHAQADENGRWKTTLDLSAVPEGPFDLQVEGSERRITRSDLLVGEVWFCSGQSNMAFTLDRAMGGADEIARSTNRRLRQFRVAEAGADEPQENCEGSWLVASPTTAAAFSAVGYFFAKELGQALPSPIGIVLSARAGTNAIAWISQDALEAVPELKSMREEGLRLAAEYPARKKAYVETMAKWEAAHHRADHPSNPAPWAEPKTSVAGWSPVELPGLLRDRHLPDSGAVWFRKTIVLPSPGSAAVVIDLGAPHDFTAIYWNGHKIGESTASTASGPADTKRYTIPHDFLAEGENVLALRLFTPTEHAGFASCPFLNLGPVRLLLDSGWFSRTEFSLPPLTDEARRDCPEIPAAPDPYCLGARLYHAMVAPLALMTRAGVLWYQGEQDTGKSRALYQTLLETLILDWRKKAGAETPFVICQLPNFGPKQADAGESSWAEIRQAQLDALRLPKTALVVLIDCGEADVHPLNKRPVGERAAAVALRAFHDRQAIPVSPLFRAMQAEGDTVTLHFQCAEDGLAAHPLPADYQPTLLSPTRQPLVRLSPDSDLQGFALCGVDRKWTWAQARIKGAQVMVRSKTVSQPISVRYAWADNPTCNLYGAGGLPASPFEAGPKP